MSDDWAKEAQEQEAKELCEKVSGISLPGDNEETKASTDTPPTNSSEATTNATPVPADASTNSTAENSTTTSGDEQAPTAAELSLMKKAMRKGIIESKNNVEIMRKDPNSPLYSVKTFEALNLRKELLEGIYDMGFSLPSKIQETALPTLMADPPVNMIAQSQSGTGKTAAFSLAMLSRIDPAKNCTQALCLSPTFELALQTAETIKNLGKKCTDIKIRHAVKGETVPRGTKLTEHIIIGTPGKVVDWVSKFRCLDLKQCQVFVLDEADVMIATQGHQDQSIRIHKQLPKTCQMMLFSATYEDDVMNFAEAIIPNPVIIRLRREEETLDNIRQMYVECHTKEEKYQAISNIYSIPVGQSMFFCHTRATASWLASRMKKDGHQVALLTGDLTPEDRVNVLSRYREGKERVLICTNVLARGIDVDAVTLVVNYDLPQLLGGKADCETYLHRIGRTGRFGKTGNAINIVDSDSSLKLLKEIEKHFNITISKLDYDDVDAIDKLAED